MFVVDTNVLIHAAYIRSSEHSRCVELLEKWRTEAAAWHVTWGICYEFLRLSTHPRVFSSPWHVMQAWSFLEALLDSPGLKVLTATEAHAGVAAEVLAMVPSLAGNILHDAHTAILMREHGIKRIFTFDVDFHRFPFLEPVNPLRS